MPDTYSGFAGRVRVTLTALAAEPEDTLDDLALPFVGTFAGTVAEYRQTAVSKGAESLRVDFIGRLGSSGQGTLYVRQFATTTCALTFFAFPGPDLTYEALLIQIIAALRAVRAVG